MHNKNLLYKFFSGLMLLIILGGSILSVEASSMRQEDGPVVISTEYQEIDPNYTIETITFSDGVKIDRVSTNGPSEPSPEFREEWAASILTLPERGTISSFPSFNWVFGCGAVSGGMIAAYYDRNGFPNIYTGPQNGGVMPLSNTWGTWSDGYATYPDNPLIASHMGVDGRTTRGSIDDYWVKSGSTANDPYITNGWTQHTWGTAIGDYMKTSQSAYGSPDGNTWAYYWNKGSSKEADKMTCADMEVYNYDDKDGAAYGRKLFYEARGYTVTECYTQRTTPDVTGGFSLADFQAQIDAGHPVYLHVDGHYMVGYGYGTGQTIYVRDTWDNNPDNHHTMQWDGTYDGRNLFGVAVVKMKKPVINTPTPVSPTGYITDRTPTFKWTKVDGAKRYKIELLKGPSTLVYIINLHKSQCNCVGAYCTYSPSTKLTNGNYKWRIKAYDGVSWSPYSPRKQFTVIPTTGFNSSFNINANGWSKVWGPWKLSTGYYRSNGDYLNVSSIVHNSNYPIFVYSARMIRKNDQIAANRLYVRGDPWPLASSDKNWDDGYYFQYANTGRFSIWKVINGTQTMVKGWTTFSGIKKNGWNTLKVVGVSNSMKFYINDHLVWKGTISGRATGRVGIGAYRSTSAISPLSVDWARLTVPTTITAPPPMDEPLAELGDTITDWYDMNVSP